MGALVRRTVRNKRAPWPNPSYPESNFESFEMVPFASTGESTPRGSFQRSRANFASVPFRSCALYARSRRRRPDAVSRAGSRLRLSFLISLTSTIFFAAARKLRQRRHASRKKSFSLICCAGEYDTNYIRADEGTQKTALVCDVQIEANW